MILVNGQCKRCRRHRQRGCDSSRPRPTTRSIWPALQDATGLPRATAHRLAVALEQHGLVRRDPQGRFCLGFELIRLGRAAEDAVPARRAGPAGAHGAARRDRRERAAVRRRRRRSALRRVAGVAARAALDRSAGGAASAGPRIRRPCSARRRRVPRVSRSASPAWPRSAPRCATAAASHRCGQPQRPGRATESPAKSSGLVAMSPKRRNR